MSKTNENKLLPKLRFSEFQKAENWRLSTIGEIGTFYYGKSAPKWSLSKDAPTPCVRYGELYTKFDTIISEIISRTNIDPSNLKFSKGGEILVPRVGEVPQDFAKNCCYLPFPNIAIGEMISVYETKEYPIFYAYYFRTLIKQFAKVVEGQNVKNLYYVNLEPIAIGKPSYLEQQKIAACLSSIDEVIKANSQKLESLNEHKKGLLQNLFPQKGETVPKWRFKEFVKNGKWDEKTLTSVSEVIMGSSPSSSAYNKNKIGLPLLQGNADIKNRLSAPRIYTSEITKECEIDDILLSVRAPVGTVAKSLHKACIGRGISALRAIKPNFQEYLYQWLISYESSWQNISQGGTFDAVNSDDIRNLLLPIPQPKEQQKIASCLSTLDSLIIAQTEKLENLTLHKSGLTQKLFPKINT